jgi:predicted nucleic acid-binding protein
VAIVYFDASACVKLVIEEPGSALAIDLWNGCDVAVASRLVYAEVCAALAAGRRNRALTTARFDRARASWEGYWGSVRAIHLTRSVERQAGALAREHPLSGADAVHLASALALGDPDVILASWDRRLAAAARQTVLTVAPATLDG